MAREGRRLGSSTLRPGEGRAVGLAVAASFFASAGLMIGESGIEALFFARYGVSKLPAMYLVLGVTMFVVTVAFGALLGRFGRGRACLLIPIVLALAAVGRRVALAADIAWITQALWLLQGAAQFLVGLAVWGLAGIVTDTRQAKRFFPLIGAGGVLGYVLGGLVTTAARFLDRLPQPARWSGSPRSWRSWSSGARLLAIGGAREDGPRRGHRAETRGPIEQLVRGFRYARGSTLMRWMALGSILFSLLFFSLYLPFSRAATDRYPDPDELAGFFGLFFGVVDRRRVPAVAVRDEPAAGSLRRADRAAGAAAPLRRRVRRAHDRRELRDLGRLPVRAGGLAVGRRNQLLGGGDQHRAHGPARSDPRVPVRGTDAGGHRAGRRDRARRRHRSAPRCSSASGWSAR